MEAFVVMTRFTLACLLGASFGEGALAFGCATFFGHNEPGSLPWMVFALMNGLLFVAAIMRTMRRSRRLLGGVDVYPAGTRP